MLSRQRGTRSSVKEREYATTKNPDPDRAAVLYWDLLTGLHVARRHLLFAIKPDREGFPRPLSQHVIRGFLVATEPHHHDGSLDIHFY